MNRNVTSNYICLECGNIFPLMRDLGAQKQLYHRRRLYCVNCKKNTIHLEVRDIDRLKAELEFINKEQMTKDEYRVYKLLKKE